MAASGNKHWIQIPKFITVEYKHSCSIFAILGRDKIDLISNMSSKDQSVSKGANVTK